MNVWLQVYRDETLRKRRNDGNTNECLSIASVIQKCNSDDELSIYVYELACTYRPTTDMPCVVFCSPYQFKPNSVAK